MDSLIAAFKSFILYIFNAFGITEEFEKMGIDISKILGVADDSAEEPTTIA